MGYSLPTGVVNSDSAFFFADDTLVLGPYVKQVTEQTLVVIDYSQVTPSIIVDELNFQVDVSSNPALVISYPQIDQTGGLITFLLSGGITGQQYNISVNVTSPSAVARTDLFVVNIPSAGDCACGTINPVPAIYTQISLGEPTQGYVNTGVRFFWGVTPPANPTVLDQWYTPDTGTLYEYITDGVSFFWDMVASDDSVEEAPESGLAFARYNGYWVASAVQTDAPANGVHYERVAGAWAMAPIQTDAPTDGNNYLRSNGAWVQSPHEPIEADAPYDDKLYGRVNGGWEQAYPESNPYGYQTDTEVALTVSYYLPLAGGTVTGDVRFAHNIWVDGLTHFVGNVTCDGSVAISNDPIEPMQAANKRYVDNRIDEIAGAAPYLSLSGGAMTGPIVLAQDPTTDDQAATKNYVDDTVAAAVVTGPYLPIRGGTITGDLIVSGVTMLSRTPTAPLEAATKAYVDANSTGGIGDSPLDGFLYGRSMNTWVRALKLSGGTLTGVLTLVGNPSANLDAAPKQYVDSTVSAALATLAAVYLPLSGGTLTGTLTLSAAPTLNLHAATKQYVDGLAGVTTPLMDGTATVGNATTWARANHIHPSDTSRLALVGGAMTGPIILANDPVANMQPATKQYVDAINIDCGTY